jgi:hypothetical protein
MNLNFVYVTNKNDFDFSDRYDGEEFFFPQGQAVLIPTAAAEHIFGFSLKDKTDALVRLGWATDIAAGAKKLANFVWEEAEMRPKSLLDVAAA